VAGDRTHYTRLEAQYATETAQYSIDIRQLIQSRSAMEATLQNKNAELVTLRAQVTQLQSMMDKDERNFSEEMSNLNAAISVLDQATELLEGARDSSFVETNHHEYGTTAENMGKAFANTKGFLYQPIVETLVQVT
jgi:predicted  nucleic acid-binding Zn-ribbon protein